MKKYHYLKCYLCRRQGECTLKMLDGSSLCPYGTGFSIWKWCVRLVTCLSLVLGTLSFILWTKFNIETLTHPYTLEHEVRSISLVMMICLLVLIGILGGSACHDGFKDRGGKYWGNS